MTVSAIKSGKAEETAEEQEKTGARRKLAVIALVVLLLAGAGYWFFLKPGGGEEAPKPGEIIALEPTQINLAAGHYLKIGIALQLTEDAEEVNGSKALDAVIDLFSGRSITSVSKAEDRHALKEKLNQELEEAYHGEVMGVYFTEFVTQ